VSRIVLRKHSEGEFAWTATFTAEDGIARSTAGHTQAEALYALLAKHGDLVGAEIAEESP
jgi:hypothetical protein